MYCVGFSPDGNCKAASDDRNIRVWWDAEGGVVIKGPLTGRSGSILFVSFSPDSQFFVSTTSYEIIVWDVGSRKMKYELLDGYFFCSIGFSSSSKTFVAGDQLETCERQVTRYVISEGVANCRHIPMGPHRFVLCKLSESYLFWTESWLELEWRISNNRFFGGKFVYQPDCIHTYRHVYHRLSVLLPW